MVFAYFDGKTDPQIVRELMRLAGLEDRVIDAKMQQLLTRYVVCLHEELRAPGHTPYTLPGVPELLDALEEEPSVTMGLLTGNLQAGATAKLAAVRLERGERARDRWWADERSEVSASSGTPPAGGAA